MCKQKRAITFNYNSKLKTSVKLLIALSALFLASAISSHSQDLAKYYANAKSAYENKDYGTFYEQIVEANKLHPYHQVILYQLAKAAALTGQPDEALLALRKAINIDVGFDLGSDDFKSIQGNESFTKLLQLQKELSEIKINSDTAFTITDNGSHIEAITYDNNSKSFYLGSIHKRKIIKKAANGKITDFIKSEEHGITSVFDIQVDEKRNILWACASPMPEMENYDSTLRAAVYKFNASTGELLDVYQTEAPIESVFGDLALDSNGVVFISDGKSNTIYMVNEKAKRLDFYFTSEQFWNIQGITFSPDDQYLFISDYIKGPFRLNTSNKQLIKIESNIEQSLKGIDGLLFYENSLIAIQNGVTPNRVVRYSLNKSLDKILKQAIIENAHPAFNEPTMGCLVENQLFYVSNSLWGAYDENFIIKPELIEDVVILKYTLQK